MRTLTCFGLVVVLLGPTVAAAQPAGVDGSIAPSAPAAPAFQLRRPAVNRPQLRHSDSIRKSALAGAAIGAAVGVMFVGAQCENNCQAGAFAASIAYFGALGAGIGAMVAMMPERTGVPLTPDGRVRVASSITRTRKAGLVSIGF